MNLNKLSTHDTKQWFDKPSSLSPVDLMADLILVANELKVARRFAKAWEALIYLENDWDDDVWYELGYQLRRLKIIQELPDVIIRYPATWEEDESEDLNETLLIEFLTEMKTTILSTVFEVVE